MLKKDTLPFVRCQRAAAVLFLFARASPIRLSVLVPGTLPCLLALGLGLGVVPMPPSPLFIDKGALLYDSYSMKKLG